MSEKESTTFHNEGAVTRLALWTNIVSWILLVITMYSFGYTAFNIISNWAQIAPGLPESVWEKISVFASQVFLDPLVGVFYFLVLRAVSQGLYLALDIFYQNDVEIVEVEDEAAA